MLSTYQFNEFIYLDVVDIIWNFTLMIYVKEQLFLFVFAPGSIVQF